jgi:hypothetical protein
MLLALLAAAAGFDLPSRTVVATVHAEGAQIYACTAGAWTFREPIAALFDDGKTVGRHYAGPRWQFDDGTVLRGRVVQSQPGQTPADVALLHLSVVENTGARLAGVTEIYRVNTHGGALAGACDTPGALRAVAYSADYVFAR